MATSGRTGGPARPSRPAPVKEETIASRQTTTANTAVLRERLPARVKPNTWWCPWDDSGVKMGTPPDACPVCGATLDGEEAVRDQQ